MLHDAPISAANGAAPELVVGVGASAGALDALRTLFAEMPGDTGMAFVVIQHLGRERPSMLTEILAGVARMPVQEAQDGAPLEANHIYVIQPDTQLRLERGLLRVEPAAATGLRLPVDVFLRALAEDRGEATAAVILSGTGADGANGLRSIKEHGGVTIVQSPQTARYDGMPQSAIQTGLADLVLPVAEIPRRLIAVKQLRDAERRDRGRQLDAEIGASLAHICEVLQRRTGHDFSRYKGSTLVRRIRRRILVRNSESVANYVHLLEQDLVEPESLLKDLLIGVTQFFREPEAFRVLSEQVIPRLFEGKPAGVPVRVWVPGCASGEEAFSVAILLEEYLERVGQSRPTQVFASDIDAEQLAIARRAIYPQQIEAQVSPERLQRYFEARGDGYRVAKQLRDVCVFSMHSLIRDPPFSSIDLISCRNLLIYLDADLQQKVISLLHHALGPGGYLFLGPSETLGGAAELFTAVDPARRIFRREETATREHLQFPLMDRGLTRVAQPKPRRTARFQPGSTQSFERIILTEYTPPSLVVDEHGQVVYSAGRTGLYLQAPAGGPSQNTFEMADGTLGVELRAALLRAARSARRVVRESIPIEIDDESRRIRLTVRPLTADSFDARLFLVVLQEATGRESSHLAEDSDEMPTGAPEDERLASELQVARSDLKTAMEELASINEELSSSNEELVSTNEELQSANEELRTSQEEMQSINEELEAVNSELREKIKEVTTATTELQNLYASSQIATVYVDSQMPPSIAAKAAWAWDWRWSKAWSTCTAGRCRCTATAAPKGPNSSSDYPLTTAGLL